METNTLSKEAYLKAREEKLKQQIAEPVGIQESSSNEFNSYYYTNNRVVILEIDDKISIIDNSGRYRTQHNISLTSAKVLAEHINQRYGVDENSHKADSDEIAELSAKVERVIIERNDCMKVIDKLEEELRRYKSIISDLKGDIHNIAFSCSKVRNTINLFTEQEENKIVVTV